MGDSARHIHANRLRSVLAPALLEGVIAEARADEPPRPMRAAPAERVLIGIASGSERSVTFEERTTNETVRLHDCDDPEARKASVPVLRMRGRPPPCTRRSRGAVRGSSGA